MKKRNMLTILIILVLSLSLLVSCGNDNKKEDNDNISKENAEDKVELTIAAAASLTDVMDEIKQSFEKENENVELVFTFNSSGALQAQIEEGAPVDIFMSAAEKQMDALEEKENIISDSRKTLLVNEVVLIKPEGSNLDVSSFEDLTNDDIKKIAIGDPASVPVGQYSEEIFNNLGINEDIKDKLIFASDVRTVLAWVKSGEVDLGIVYATDAYTSDKVEIITSAPEGSHKLVTYPVAVVKGTNNEDIAKEFINFLSTNEIVEIFKSYGFEMN